MICLSSYFDKYVFEEFFFKYTTDENISRAKTLLLAYFKLSVLLSHFKFVFASYRMSIQLMADTDEQMKSQLYLQFAPTSNWIELF